MNFAVRHRALWSLVLIAAGSACSAERPATAVAPAAADANSTATGDGSTLDPSGRFRYSGAFASEGEKAKLLGNLGKAAGFLAHWEALGYLITQKPLRVFVAPPKSVTGHDRLVAYFGAGVDAEIDAAHAAVNAAKSGAGVYQAMQDFSCAHPLFAQLALGYPEHVIPRLDANLAGEKARLVGQLDALKATNEFDDGGSDFGVAAPWRMSCAPITLARDRENAFPIASDALESADDLSVILHELGHVISIDDWTRDDPPAFRLMSPAISEAVADLYAATYLDDPCIAPTLGVLLSPTAECFRRVDVSTKTLSDGLLSEEPHTSGNALRHVFWDLFTELGPAEFDGAFAAAIDAVTPILTSPPDWSGPGASALPPADDIGAANGPVVAPDLFLGLGLVYVDGFDQATAMVNAACAGRTSSAACETATARLGTRETEVVSSLVANSPYTVGEAGRDVTVGGAPHHVSFRSTLNRATAGQVPTWTATVTSAGGKSEVYTLADDVGLGGPPHTYTLALLDAAHEPRGSWRSDGVLVLANGAR